MSINEAHKNNLLGVVLSIALWTFSKYDTGDMFARLEKFYQKKYHLRFVHAKKLFAFDLALLVSIMLIAGVTISWVTYHPATGNVLIALSASTERIKSGTPSAITITYTNQGQGTLHDVQLRLQPPPSFIPDSPAELTTSLKDLPAKQTGHITVPGHFYTPPNEPARFVTEISYQSENVTGRASTIATWLATTRSSIVTLVLHAPADILSPGATPITVDIANGGDDPMDVALPLPQNPELLWNHVMAKTGTIEGKKWLIPGLAPHTTTSFSATLETNAPNEISTAHISLRPAISFNGTEYPQTPVAAAINLVHVNIELAADWENKIRAALPGQNTRLHLTLTNHGVNPLNDLMISLAIPTGVIDTARLTTANDLAMTDNLIILNQKNFPALATLPPGATRSMALDLPLRAVPTGAVDIVLQPRLAVHASLPRVSGEVITEKVPPPLLIGTTLTLDGDLRYYTPEGDQLGRGPLPPRVGQETKYWAMFTITNTTSEVADVQLSAMLTPSARWTGNSSVSLGHEPSWYPATRRIEWTAPTLAPHETATIAFAVGFTPAATESNLTPVLIRGLTLTAHDTYIDTRLTSTLTDLDISLPKDAEGRAKGIAVLP